MAEVTCGALKFLSFVYNERDVPTSMIKKEITRGDAKYEKVEVDRIVVECRPYLHQNVDGKNETLF